MRRHKKRHLSRVARVVCPIVHRLQTSEIKTARKSGLLLHPPSLLTDDSCFVSCLKNFGFKRQRKRQIFALLLCNFFSVLRRCRVMLVFYLATLLLRLKHSSGFSESHSPNQSTAKETAKHDHGNDNRQRQQVGWHRQRQWKSKSKSLDDELTPSVTDNNAPPQALDRGCQAAPAPLAAEFAAGGGGGDGPRTLDARRRSPATRVAQ